ncbi:hypothetical protein EJ04DRAFT_56352 [Polyplosphaeria fusca]|uniref:Uncharacterized protein n=1 Tax=Polyplosphaeria fusca TaxID=682080 RepID=A0A9P4UYD7_9PLEO|nr:hypothetical protein EJ04DRAFT_56352 [Polyplosphaeria fusca]
MMRVGPYYLTLRRATINVLDHGKLGEIATRRIRLEWPFAGLCHLAERLRLCRVTLFKDVSLFGHDWTQANSFVLVASWQNGRHAICGRHSLIACYRSLVVGNPRVILVRSTGRTSAVPVGRGVVGRRMVPDHGACVDMVAGCRSEARRVCHDVGVAGWTKLLRLETVGSDDTVSFQAHSKPQDQLVDAADDSGRPLKCSSGVLDKATCSLRAIGSHV